MPKKTVKQIVESGNHYTIQVKSNQPKLLQDIQKTFKETAYRDTHIMEECEHGIKTTWQLYCYNYTNNLKEWETIGIANRVCKTVIEADNTVTYSERVYISNKKDVLAKEFNEGIRGHWGIENKAHKPKDMAFNQDGNKVKHINAAFNRAIINTLAVNLLTKEYEETIAYAQILFGQNVKEYLTKIRN